jgi:hypothetical protein
LSAPNSPKTKRGANGKFLPKPLLFHLRHPNSKTNEPKFWQILSPKNSFCKTSSALFRHLPETLRAEHQRKMSFPFLKKLVARKFEKQGTFFFGVRRTRRVAGLIHSFSFPSKKVRAKCIITAPVVTCSELGIWSDFAEAKIAL